MQAARLFLLQTHTQDAAILDPLAEFLRQAGRDVSRILVPQEVLDGTDQAAIATLSQLRDASGAVTTDASRPKTILIAFGISASFALWMNILDLTKPKKTRIRSSTVMAKHLLFSSLFPLHLSYDAHLIQQYRSSAP